MAAQAFEVPVVAQDLRPSETYDRLCGSLLALRDAATAIFDALGERHLSRCSAAIPPIPGFAAGLAGAAAMAAQAFEVSAQDLRPSETYDRLCGSLLALRDAATAVFDALGERVKSLLTAALSLALARLLVDEEQQRLQGLSRRIRAVQASIDNIEGSQKALTIFSPSKYPVVDPVDVDYVSVFRDRAGSKTCTPQRLSGIVDAPEEQEPRGAEEALELFRFFSETAQEPLITTNEHIDGLGDIPQDTDSATSLLLFNTTEVVYGRSYRHIDNLTMPLKDAKEELQMDDDTGFSSILTRESELGEVPEDFGFRPVLGTVPEISLPPSLPNLPMIADLNWGGRSLLPDLPPIAPSAVLRATTLPNPALTPPSPGPSTQGMAASVSPLPITLDTSQQPQRSAELHRVPAATSTALGSEEIKPLSESGPSSSRLVDKDQRTAGQPTVKSPAPAISSDPLRAALMESIRNPGLILRKRDSVGEVKKRPPNDRDVEGTSAPVVNDTGQARQSPTVPSMDMFAEMTNVLRLRRLAMQTASEEKIAIARLHASIAKKAGKPQDEVDEESDWSD
eukprot:SM000069S20671  [mRNA]  locus=s69:13094:19027:- [translate_table: standard]